MPTHRQAAIVAVATLAAVSLGACQRNESVTYRRVVPASALPHIRAGLWTGPHYASGQPQTLRRLCKSGQTRELVLADQHCVSATVRRTASGGYRLAMTCTVGGQNVQRHVNVEGDLTTHYSIDASHGPDRGDADGGDYAWRGPCPPGMPAAD